VITSVDAGVLGIAYEERGVPRGAPVVRSHGFPFDAMTRARKPVIAGPAISLDGNSESVAADIGGRLAERFAGGYDVRAVPAAGHNPPQGTPQAFARALIV